MTSKWVTRERPKIDRIACPWLIRRFVAKDAEFIYVPIEQVFTIAKETGATPYDIPGAEPFSHHGEQCSFDAFLDHYELHEPALDRLALIVRGADTARLERRAAGGRAARGLARPVGQLHRRPRHAGAGDRRLRRALHVVPFATARDA